MITRKRVGGFLIEMAGSKKERFGQQNQFIPAGMITQQRKPAWLGHRCDMMKHNGRFSPMDKPKTRRRKAFVYKLREPREETQSRPTSEPHELKLIPRGDALVPADPAFTICIQGMCRAYAWRNADISTIGKYGRTISTNFSNGPVKSIHPFCSPR